MTRTEEHRLSAYQDFGFLDEKEKIRLKKNRHTGALCVEKHIAPESASVYRYLAEHPSPAAPKILECIETEGYLLILEEFIEGETLEELLEESPFTEERAVSVISSLCAALLPLHQADPPIICRDLKAENVMIDRAGEVRIVDFDISRTWQPGKTRDTRLLGTREYAAPEQFGFRQTDARTDIYALGVLFNYLLLRKFPAEEMAAGEWGEIVRRCTHMDPEQRYQSVEELAAALRKAQEGKNRTWEKSASDGRRCLAPPGFRTRTPWKMLTAVLGYLVLTWFCFTLELNEDGEPLTGGHLRFEQMLIWLSQLLFIGILFNYCGMRDRLPLVRSSNILIRILGLCAAWIILFALAALLAVMAEGLW